MLEQEDIIRTFSDSPHVVAIVSKDEGTPAFVHVVDTLRQCHTIDQVYLDTGSGEVPDADVYVQAIPSAPFPRPRAIDEAIFAFVQCPPRVSTGSAIERVTVGAITLAVIRKPRTRRQEGRDRREALEH